MNTGCPIASNNSIQYIAVLNPNLMNGFIPRYHLGESILIFRVFRCDFKISLYISIIFLYENRIAPDGTPRSAASHLGLFCLPMSHKRDARLQLHLENFQLYLENLQNTIIRQ